MTRTLAALIRLSIGTFVGSAALMWNGQLPLDSQSSLVSSAEARIGRPFTPLSYAGVARRTTRRAVVYGAAAGAVYAAPRVVAPATVVVAPATVVVAPAPVVVAPARVCGQAVDAYGRIVTVCR